MAVRPSCRRLQATLAIDREAEIEIAADEEVQVSVPVEIQKAGASHPSLRFEADSRGDVLEFFAPAVSIKDDRAVIGDEQIGEAVVVIVGRRCTHAIAPARDAIPFSYVFE